MCRQGPYLVQTSTDHPNKGPHFADNPISSKQEDSLGRTEFIEAVAENLQKIQATGARILIAGEWGSGKTSFINCLQKEIEKKKDNKKIFVRVNPWHNDTKERFLRAILSEINNFSQNTKPAFSVTSDDFVEFSSFSLFGLSFSHRATQSNIGHTVDELNWQMEAKQQDLVIIVDDLDRLSKSQILDIFSVIYMFNQTPHLMFLLSGSITILQNILTETGQSCQNNKFLRQNICVYDKYIDKIATNIIRLPEPEPYFLKETWLICVKQLLKNNPHAHLPANLFENIPVSLFPTVREMKRTLNTFQNSFFQPKVEGEVEVFHFLLITILYAQFERVYQHIRKEKNYWIENAITSNMQRSTDHISATWAAYFDKLFSYNPEKENELKQLFFILNPNYRTLLAWREQENYQIFSLQFQEILATNFPKALYNPYYFSRYFTQNFSQDIISDKIVEDIWNKADSLPTLDKKAAWIEHQFIEYKNKLPSFFDYIMAHIRTFPVQRIEAAFLAWRNCETARIYPISDIHQIFERILELLQPRCEDISPDVTMQVFDTVVSPYYQMRLHLFYTKYFREQAPACLKKLQQNSWSAHEIVEECIKFAAYPYGTSLFYEWMRNFVTPGPYVPQKLTAGTKELKTNEAGFWTIMGEDLYHRIQSPVKEKYLGWSKDLLKEIIQALLEHSQLQHQKQLEEILAFLDTTENNSSKQ